MTDFAEVFTIVERGERAIRAYQFELGDALNRAVGPPSRDGRNNGSAAKLEDCSRQLLMRGHEYTADALRKLRDTAAIFPPGSREPGVSFSSHRIAGTPEMLRTIIQSAPEGQLITASYVSGVMTARAIERQREIDRVFAEETKLRQRKTEEARRERERAEADARNARSVAARREAEQRAKAAAKKEAANKTPVKRPEIPEDSTRPEDVPVLLARVAFTTGLADQVRTLKKLAKDVEPFIAAGALEQATVEYAFDTLTELKSLADTLQTRLRKLKFDKRGHLSVVA